MTEPTATFTTEGHTPVLIEDWLPIRELGIESVRERKGMFNLPPLPYLHVWWARAPLAAAQGVTLASLLPPWSDDLLDVVEGLSDALESVAREVAGDARGKSVGDHRHLYHHWVLKLCGVRGDIISENDLAMRQDRAPQFATEQAFRYPVDVDDAQVLHALLIHRWGHLPSVLDPTAGGGSLPFAAMKYGLRTYANDLNPVAATILRATLRTPVEYGDELLEDLRTWGRKLQERCVGRLEAVFELSDPEEEITAYFFANTVACPRTGGDVPLVPSWWLQTGGVQKFAVRPHPVRDSHGNPVRVEFEIVENPNDFDPGSGSVARGRGISVWDDLVIDNDYIKEEANAGRMWPTLYAVAAKKPKRQGRGFRKYFRSPDEVDSTALDRAGSELDRLREGWLKTDVIPSESISELLPRMDGITPYGIRRWADLFTPRQLLSHGVFVEEWRGLLQEARGRLGSQRAESVMFLLALSQAKSTNFNSKLSGWQPTNGVVKNVFDRHDFGFKWTFCEFGRADELYSWSIDSLISAYQKLSGLVNSGKSSGLFGGSTLPFSDVVDISTSTASRLSHIDNSSIELVNIDPPYYDNVMYAQLADFFYVWEKRTLGEVFPEVFAHSLSNKDDEAVANSARFQGPAARREELATFDYQQKMQAIFSECHRALVADGVMVVWFTHRRSEAWDTLATSIIESGFTIEASWPVTTQPETALNHARKNSARSTIMLVCRKRQSIEQGEVFFEDIEVALRQAARAAVEKFEAEVGVGGVDLQLATYGPTLSVISRNWPVLSSEPDETGRSRRLRPEEALDVARQEVARLRMQRLVGRDATFDPASDFWLMCWETFQAREFPYDEARKLALGVGHDVDEAINVGLLKKKASNVELVNPTTRGRALRRLVDDAGRFERLVDALHFMLVTYRDDKLAAARTWLSDSGYGSEQRFLDAVQAAVNAVPRVRTKKGLSLEEAVLLEDAVVALFGDEISLPVEAEEKVEAEQMTLGS